MIDSSYAPSAFNRFVNLDGVEDRIIYYLLSPYKKTPKNWNKLILFGNFCIIMMQMLLIENCLHINRLLL